MNSENLLEVKGLSLSIVGDEDDHRVINNICFDVTKGKITCLVGESGSGKTMTIASILGLTPEKAYFSDQSSIQFSGESIFSIFQDPMNSFNQSIKIRKQIFNMVNGYMEMTQPDFERSMETILRKLNFKDPQRVLGQYPFELSGGMLQRLMIACGMLIEPTLIIADEPTTALDVTIQKEILREFITINRELKTTLFVVTHDFGVVAEIADEVIVMQKGKIVELGNVFEIFDNPKEDYTKRLIKATFKELNHADVC